jgi:hypothetical protein
MTELIVAISYTKQRTMFGMVGVEIDSQKRVAFVRLAKQWSRKNMNSIPGDIKELHKRVKWNNTIVDQQVGQHLIKSFEMAMSTGLQVITTQKNLRDPENIELLKVMDITEMTQLTLSIKQDHRIQFPKKNHTEDMMDLMKQMEMFTEHITESGTVAYYAPGEELDCLPRALMMCCFAARNSLEHGVMPIIIKQGVNTEQTPEQSFDSFFSTALGDDYENLDEQSLNRTNKFKIFDRTKRRI